MRAEQEVSSNPQKHAEAEQLQGGPKYGTTAQMPLTSVAPPVNILDNTTYMQPRVRRYPRS